MLETLDRLMREAGPAGLALIAAGAFVEYVFPPFPGDTVTVLGGVWAVRGGWPVWLVFALVMSGSLAGAMVDFAAGRWVGARLDTAPAQAWYVRRIDRARLKEWEERFKARGIWWLAVNRFLPAIRGPIFFAAGVARVPLWKVLLYGGASAFVWNALLFAAGYAVGGEAEKLAALVAGYGKVAWAVLGIVAVALGVRWWLGRRRQKAGS
ncbi:MAG TPA: DedA family protein [Myxococcales bacterium]|jgi:membrane protein DedA with SNARE-associated domain